MENYTQMGGNRECTHIQTKMYRIKYIGKCREVYGFEYSSQKFELNKQSDIVLIAINSIVVQFLFLAWENVGSLYLSESSIALSVVLL